MSKFCKECGQPLDDSLKFCQHCGHQVDTPAKERVAKAVIPKKQPKIYTKKQKVLFSIAAGLLILIGGFYTWGKSYYSVEKTSERFVSAITDEDFEKVQSLASMGGTSISEAEAKALITLAKEESNYINLNPEEFLYNDGLFRIIEDGKALLLFQKHTISLMPQYAALQLPFEGIEVTFNETAFDVHEEADGVTVFGPISPGKYELHSSFSGEFTTAESDSAIILGNSYGDWVYQSVELEADFVQFSLYNQIQFPITNAYITVNDQEVAFEDNQVINRFGPLNIDGSITVTPTIETEWGKMTLDEITIEDSYYEIVLDTLSEELITELSDTILLYGEEYVQAHAENNPDLFTNITTDLRDIFVSNFEQYVDRDTSFTGQLDKIEIDFSRANFSNENTLRFPANFYFTSSTFDADEEAELEERIDIVNVEMLFDSEDKKWLINSSSSRGMFNRGLDVTHTLEGSQELFNASTTASAPATGGDEDLTARIEETTLDYVHNLVAAINADDYELVRPYVKDDSPLHEMQADLVSRLADDGMKQEVIEASVEKVEQDGDTWKVTTNETIKLIYASGDEKTTDYEWVYTVEVNDDKVGLTNIE